MSAGDPAESAVALSTVFAALGDATRLELVGRLSHDQPQSIAQLASGLAQSRQGVTKHLRVLERAGLVAARRAGREQLFTCVPDRIDAARYYIEAVSDQWRQALQRLQAHVAEDP